MPGGSVESLASLFPGQRIPLAFGVISRVVHLIQLRGMKSIMRMLMRRGKPDWQSPDLSLAPTSV